MRPSVDLRWADQVDLNLSTVAFEQFFSESLDEIMVRAMAFVKTESESLLFDSTNLHSVMSSSGFCMVMGNSGILSNSRGGAITDRQTNLSAAALQEQETPRTLSKALTVEMLEYI